MGSSVYFFFFLLPFGVADLAVLIVTGLGDL